jgi:hypothetical protein
MTKEKGLDEAAADRIGDFVKRSGMPPFLPPSIQWRMGSVLQTHARRTRVRFPLSQHCFVEYRTGGRGGVQKWQARRRVRLWRLFDSSKSSKTSLENVYRCSYLLVELRSHEVVSRASQQGQLCCTCICCSCWFAGFLATTATVHFCSFLPGKGAAGAQLVEELKTSALTQSKRAMEGLEDMALLMEFLDIYGVLDKVRLCYCMGR